MSGDGHWLGISLALVTTTHHRMLHQSQPDMPHASPHPPAGADSCQPLPYVPGWTLPVAALLMLVNAVISMWLQLGLHRQIGLSTFRCLLQLLILGYILVPLVQFGGGGSVVVFGVAITFLATTEIISQPSHACTVSAADSA